MSITGLHTYFQNLAEVSLVGSSCVEAWLRLATSITVVSKPYSGFSSLIATYIIRDYGCHTDICHDS